MPPAIIDKQQFCRVCGKFATGVAVATVLDSSGEPHGMTINSFASVSMVPPLVSFCVDHRTRMLEYFRASGHFGINVLGEQQQHLSQHFARPGHNRFTNVEWHSGKTGVPLMHGVLATIECLLVKRFTVGDHDILVGEVLHTHAREGKPLVFFASEYRKLQ